MVSVRRSVNHRLERTRKYKSRLLIAADQCRRLVRRFRFCDTSDAVRIPFKLFVTLEGCFILSRQSLFESHSSFFRV